ncbi:HTH-type transcriptional regulator IolR [Synergistales bacterium]|nr:HTH-type transcriptional regulator IolR [Synergistales bacterium]
MLRMQRIDAIESYVIQRRRVDLDALCEYFSVSKNTIRRDIDDLEKRGSIKKIYGGVCAAEKNELPAFKEHAETAPERKKRVAAAAASFVENGDIIFIDSGTTTYHLAEYVSDRKNLTILTNNLNFITSGIPCENLTIISLPGTLNRRTLSFTGANTAQALEAFNISKAFMASTGITVERGATNYYAAESEIKRMAMRRSRRNYLLADHTKLGVISLVTYADLKEFDCLITEPPLPDEFKEYMDANGKEVLLVG